MDTDRPVLTNEVCDKLREAEIAISEFDCGNSEMTTRELALFILGLADQRHLISSKAHGDKA